MKVLIFIVIIILIYLWMIKPNTSRKEAMREYEKVYIAHRGLFNNLDVPENSLKGFKKAVENGYGIELDVQMTTDNKLVVFHDVSLKRMTGIDKKLTDCSYDELLQYNLLDTEEKIPLFEDVLKVLKPETPLVIEIKPEGRCIDTVRDTVKLMREYEGLYNIESFNPKVVHYLRKNEPDIIRGQLSYDYFKGSEHSFFLKLILSFLLTNFLTRPDYIAYDCNATYNLSFRLCSKLFKGECVAWTVKSQKQLEEIRPYYKQFIFDSFIPKR